MKMWIKSGGLVLVLLMSMQWAFAIPFVREASFQRIFDGKDYFGAGKDLSIKLSTMSDMGNIVAFYGTDSAGRSPTLFIHQFDSTAEPIPVTLPDEVGIFQTNAGLTINAIGSRIFFVADDALDTTYGDFLFCVLDTTTMMVTVLLDARPGEIDRPTDIATDANGTYLYFNETDNGDQGDLWRIKVIGSHTRDLLIRAGEVVHPSGGYGRFIDEFGVSDDGSTIAFFIEGVSGSTERYDKELFVKIGAGTPRYLTDDDNAGVSSSKSKLRLSGNGTTIVYSGNETYSGNLMVTKTNASVGAQQHIEEGYHTFCNKPGITTDGSIIFTLLNPATVSSPHGYLIRSDGSGRLKMDTRSSYSGVEAKDCTSEGVHLSGGGNRVFFKARPYVASIGTGTWVTSLYTGIFNNSPWSWLPNPPWPTEVPTVFHVDYPAPVGTMSPDNFPPFKVTIGVSDPENVTHVFKVATQMLRYNGYPDNGGYGPIKVSDPVEKSLGSWEASGNREKNWPNPVAPKDYDPLEQEIARFSVKDIDGHVAYRDVILQAGDGRCSGIGAQKLYTVDNGKITSCIADELIETVGEVIVGGDGELYLSAPGLLNAHFKVQPGGTVSVRVVR